MQFFLFIIHLTCFASKFSGTSNLESIFSITGKGTDFSRSALRLIFSLKEVSKYKILTDAPYLSNKEIGLQRKS